MNLSYTLSLHYHYFMLEQNMFNITLKSFDDNKVLKNCQLDLLIFVQVNRIIDKKLRLLLGSGRTKESKEFNKKEA